MDTCNEQGQKQEQDHGIELMDLGDAMEETMQRAPAITYPDCPWGLGIRPGGC